MNYVMCSGHVCDITTTNQPMNLFGHVGLQTQMTKVIVFSEENVPFIPDSRLTVPDEVSFKNFLNFKMIGLIKPKYLNVLSTFDT